MANLSQNFTIYMLHVLFVGETKLIFFKLTQYTHETLKIYLNHLYFINMRHKYGQPLHVTQRQNRHKKVTSMPHLS